MMLIATFLTSHFGEWRQSWHGVQRNMQMGGDPVTEASEVNAGILAAIDFGSGKVVQSVTLNSPAGFAVHGDWLYLASMYGNRIVRLGMDFQVKDSFATRLMNDLHSVVADDTGVLVTCSGTDSVLEVDYSGVQNWSWLASEHGFRMSPSGHRVRIDTKHDYRLDQVPTVTQATHCNSVLRSRLDGRDVLLVTLFHQGQVISVDRATGRASVLARGMVHPHAIRRRDGGWTVCDSESHAVILLSEDFWIQAVIESDFNWVQDALAVDDGILIADANNSRIVLWDTARARPSYQISYPEEWKIYQIEVADGRWEDGIRSLAESFSPARPASAVPQDS
jgi:hypothetical protein